MKKTFLINQLQMIPKKYENIRKITLSEGDDYTTGHLLDYNYFNKRYKMTTIDLREQQAFDADLKAILQIILIIID